MVRQESSPSLSRVAALLGFACLVACTAELPPGVRPPDATPGQATQAGASESLSAAQPGGYDPSKDPLVNPKSLTEPLPADTSRVDSEAVLIRHLAASPPSLNPIFHSTQEESWLGELLFDSLFTFDSKMQWQVNHDVVDSCEETSDGLQTRVRMKPGLKWQDGKPWTAHDVRFSWQAILDDRVPCPAVKTGTDQIVDVQVHDDLTLTFVHKEPLATNKWNVLFPIIPKHIFDDEKERRADPSLQTSAYYVRYARETVVGNGPYKLLRWVPNEEIVVERWDGFHGSKPHFKKQILKIHTDQNTALLLFKKGDLDEMQLSAAQFARETADNAFARHGVKLMASEWSYYCITWNQDGSNPFFNDVRVRRAMAHAVDVDRVIRDVHYSLFERCRGLYHPSAPMFNSEVKLLEYDPQKSAALLDEAGWKVGADGWRYKSVGGQERRFSFELMMPKENPYIEKVAAHMAENLKAIGVEMTQRRIEWVAQNERARKHEFQAMAAGWGTGTDPDTNYNIFHSSSYKDGRNYGGYNNPEVDRLFELARRELDHEKRMGLYRQIHKLTSDDQPQLCLWNRAILWAFNKNLHGVQSSPRGVFSFSPSHMDWWVAKGAGLHD